MFHVLLPILLAAASTAASTAAPSLLFVAQDPGNDILAVAKQSSFTVKRFDALAAALAVAAPGDGLLLMADGMKPASPGIPQNGTTVVVTGSEWAAIRKKELRVYIEFPRNAPPPSTSTASSSAAPLPVAQTLWERVVVPAPSGIPGLAALALLHPHKHVDFVKLPSAWLGGARSDLVLATVAGFDNASFGLPPSNVTWPMLARPDDATMVAATQLSHCRRRRFAPSLRWMSVVAHILKFVSSSTWSSSSAVSSSSAASAASDASTAPPLWTASVTASYTRDEPLPADAERQALIRGVQFYRTARLLPDAKRARSLAMILPSQPDYVLEQRKYVGEKRERV